MTTTLEQPATAVQTPLTLTEAAASEVKSLVAEQERDDLYLRVYVAGGGCSGLQYGMALDENIEPGDEVFEHSGVRMVVDSTSLRYVTGSVVDYITTDMGGGFKIENPNAVKSCGCGSSFSAGDEEAAGLDTRAGGGCGSCGCH
ncbi:MAG: iron-sulfur cluster insertion protein ErpA [Armatimonadetes bacterium]|nr:iron-sulfur cluster insertion protein ErpA [Armatimonadota bacterium]